MTDQGEPNEITPADDTLFESEAPVDDAAEGIDTPEVSVIDGASDQGDPTDPWQGMEVRPRPDDKATDAADEALSADDANADADLPRLSRQEKQRARQRIRFSTAIPALLLIVGGILALARPVLRNGILAVWLVSFALVLSLRVRLFFHGPRERRRLL